MSTRISTIPQMRRVYRATYANLPITGLRVGDLGYATDRRVFYRWSGAAWQSLTIYSGSGVAANIPTAADLPNGSLYQETDTHKLMEVQGGAWICIFYSSSGTAANIPAAAGIPEGGLYHETDTSLLKQIQSGAWGTITSPGTKEFFAPAIGQYGVTEQFADGKHTGHRIDAENEHSYIEFYVPADFTSITDAVVVCIALATGTHRLKFFTHYGGQGDDKDGHSESIFPGPDTAMTDELIYEIDISAALSALAAGDYVGVNTSGDGTNIPNVLIIGIRFKYA